MVPCLYHLYQARAELTLDLRDKEPLEHASPAWLPSACQSHKDPRESQEEGASLLPSSIGTEMVLQGPLAAVKEVGDLQGRGGGMECTGWV